MDSIVQTTLVIRGKIFRPPVTSDLVRRDDLLAKLEQDRNHRLTLVSAPAGYGKTTLISSWLDSNTQPSAWLSLDESDSELFHFLNYFITTIQTLFPSACSKSLTFVQADDKPTSAVLSAQLINDLQEIAEPFVVAIDDYHSIQDSAIHNQIDEILKYSGSMHLVIITRRNPSFSLGSLRARGLMTEIRMQDLEFSSPESVSFMRKACSGDLNEDILQRLHGEIEGWPAGMRLAALALQRRKDPEEFIRGFSSGNREVQDYLVSEVVDSLSPVIRDLVQKTSILNRFCAALIEAICRDEKTGPEHESVNGQQFIRLIEDAGLFSIPLDDEQKWYRYHHLFQAMQRNYLAKNLGRKAVSALHLKAGSWFENHGLSEDAIYHYLESGKPELAGQVISRNRQELTNNEDWVQIIRLLDLIPIEIVENTVDLLILYGRTLDKKGMYEDWINVNSRIEKLLGEGEPTTELERRHHGELAFMQGGLLYVDGQGPEAVEQLARGLQLMPQEAISERAYATLLYACALQMVGDLKGAYDVIYDSLQRYAHSAPTFHGRLLETLCFVNWMAANLPEMEKAAESTLDIGHKFKMEETVYYGQYFLGVCYYQNNQLDKALKQLAPLVENPYSPGIFLHIAGVQISCMIHQIQGRSDLAQELSTQLWELVIASGGGTYMPLTQALQAELDIKQGNISKALAWANEFAATELSAGYMFSIPSLVVVKVLLADNSPESLRRANQILLSTHSFFTTTHNDRFLAAVLALQSMYFELSGEKENADKHLTQALHLTQPGGDIRLYVDLGAQLLPMLNRLQLNTEGLQYAGKILSAFAEESSADQTSVTGAETPNPNQLALLTPLTARELEILQLLPGSLSNKEISEKLSISSKTVRRHTENIYTKLGVHRRQDAISKALGLGIIES